jgi:nucleotide-binding universal stress UspA family protein
MSTTLRPRVIVGIEDSIAGLRALRVAVDEARRREVSLHAVRAWSAPSVWGGTGLPLGRQEMTAAAIETIRRVFDDAFGGLPGDVPVVLVTGEGPPGLVLSRYAYRDDDLLLVGARRSGWLGRLSRLLRPSVARYCLTHAACPVLAIPPDSFARAATRRGAEREFSRELSVLTVTGAGER